MYDWANSAFALIVMAGFFPILLKGYWAAGMNVNESSFWLGIGNAVAALVVGLISPTLGALADQAGSKKRLLLFFTGLGALMTACLYFVAKGQWEWGVIIYIIASISHSSSKPFYNALLLNVTTSEHYARVSTFGYAMGYVGGGLLFALNAWMIVQPAQFGLADKMEAIRWAFILVGLWWALFSLPILLFVNEGTKHKTTASQPKYDVWRELKRQLRHIYSVRILWWFLVAYWFYIGAVGTISRMGVDYGLSLGFTSGNMIIALLLSQVVAFPAALLFGALGTRLGERACILACIAIYIAVCFGLYSVETVNEFYGLAALIGSVLGGVQALSRSLYARIIPKSESAGLFGFYNTITRLSVVLGPALMGLASMLSGDTRLSIISVAVLLLIGGAMLIFLRDVNDPSTLSYEYS